MVREPFHADAPLDDPIDIVAKKLSTPGKSDRKVDRRSPWTVISPRNISAIYVLLVICVVFSIWSPSTFPTVATVQEVLTDNAITALAALALIVPLSARVFDLSFAYTMTLAGVIAAYFVVNHHLNVYLSFVIAILVSICIGAINGIVVVVMRIDSFIATLATGSLILSFIVYFTNGGIDINSPILSGSFSKLGLASVGGITFPVFYALAFAVILWIFMQHTATGRRLYAIGFNPEAARLANIRIHRLRFCSLLISAGIAGAAGVVLASSLSAGSTSAGTPYLLPCFAAAFVGATQFKGSRFNAWGTLLAVIMLGTGVVGLGLADAPSFTGELFTGVVLIAALAGSGMRKRELVEGSIGRMERLRAHVTKLIRINSVRRV
jgi:ribose transport system permease protein